MSAYLKPTVNTHPVADTYSGPSERIVEFGALGSKGYVGGLISLRMGADGTLRLDVYRCDPGVRVTVGDTVLDAAPARRESAPAAPGPV